MNQGQIPPEEMRQGPKGGGAGVVSVKNVRRGWKTAEERDQIQGMVITPAGQWRNSQPGLKGRIKEGRTLRRSHEHLHPGLALLSGKIDDLTLASAVFASKIQMRHPRSPERYTVPGHHLIAHVRSSGRP